MRERKPRSWPSLSADPETRAAEALTRLEDVTRLVSDLVWETDADFRLAYVSEHAFEGMGYVPLQLEGKRFEELGEFVDDRKTASVRSSPMLLMNSGPRLRSCARSWIP